MPAAMTLSSATSPMRTSAQASELPADLGLFTILGDGTKPPREVHVDDDTLRAIYRELLRIRVIDTRMMLLQRQGRVGFYGACTGQEAVPIACAFATKKSDWIFPALREQAIMLARDFPLTTFVAQVFGN